jgi:hypothetical protein
MNVCWSNAGEASDFVVWKSCPTGFRAALVECCPAPASATPPPASLPEPPLADQLPVACGRCEGSSYASEGPAACGGAPALNELIAKTATYYSKEGVELRAYRFNGPCGISSGSRSVCTPGFKRNSGPLAR